MILEQRFRVRPHVHAAMEVKGEVLKDVAQPTAGRTSTTLSSFYLLDFCCHLTLLQDPFVCVFVSGYECLCRLPVYISFSVSFSILHIHHSMHYFLCLSLVFARVFAGSAL